MEKRLFIFFHITTVPIEPGPPPHRGFTITLRHITVGRTPLDEWSARHSDLYLKTLNNHNRQISMSPAGLKPTISAGEQPQTYALFIHTQSKSVNTLCGHNKKTHVKSQIKFVVVTKVFLLVMAVGRYCRRVRGLFWRFFIPILNVSYFSILFQLYSPIT